MTISLTPEPRLDRDHCRPAETVIDRERRVMPSQLITSDQLNEATPVLYVSSFAPSGVGGSAVIMRDVLGSARPNDIRLFVSSEYYKLATEVDGKPPRWQATTFRLPPLRGSVPGLRTALSLLRGMSIPIIGYRVARLAKNTGVRRILAIQDSGEFLVGSWIAARLTRIPLLVYMTDDWEASSRSAGALPGAIARLFLARIARDAAHVWVISEDMQREWRRRFDKSTEILTHSVDLSLFSKRPAQDSSTLRIVCVGSVYSVNEAPLRNVIRAVAAARAAGVCVSLRLLTRTVITPRTFGFDSLEGVEVGFVEPQELPGVLAEANVSLIALSFDPQLRRVVETAYPTKLAEYLAAGLPVVVHAPSYATAAQVVKGASCGIVVDTEDPSAIENALTVLAHAPDVRREMSQNARELATQNHNLDETRRRFIRRLQDPV